MSTIQEAGGQQPHLRISQDLEYWAYIATFGKWGFINRDLWVGKSSRYAKKTGWSKKYLKRRMLCPTLEQWEERVVPRLTAPQLENFRVIRAQVGSNFLLSNLIVGKTDEARRIFDSLKNELPDTRPIRILKFLNHIGWPGWKIAGLIFCFKEWSKSAIG
jgi:hypothetical protein